MPLRVHDVGPLREQLAAPLVVLARGARERERTHALGMHHADDLRDHAAHRRADDVRALDALGVEHRDRVGGHADEVVRAGRRIRVPGAAIVGRDATVTTTERAALQRPTAVIHAETLDHQDGRTVAATPRAVRDLDAIVGNRRRHCSRLPALRSLKRQEASSRAPTARRIASVKRAAASGSVGSYGSRNVTIGPNVTSHDPSTAPKRPTGADRGGNDRCERERARDFERSIARAGAQPRRRERDADEMPGAQRRRDIGAAARDRTEATRHRARGTADRARRRRGAADRSSVAPRRRARRAPPPRSRGSRR